MKIKHQLLKILEYAFYFGVFHFFRLGVHEWCHLHVLSLLGGKGHIIQTLWGAACVFDKLPSYPNPFVASVIVAFSGGLGLGFMLLFIANRNFWDLDVEEYAAVFPAALSELFYGTFEGFMLPSFGLFRDMITFSQFLAWGQFIGLIGWLLGMAHGWYVMFKVWLEK